MRNFTIKMSKVYKVKNNAALKIFISDGSHLEFFKNTTWIEKMVINIIIWCVQLFLSNKHDDKNL